MYLKYEANEKRRQLLMQGGWGMDCVRKERKCNHGILPGSAVNS
jgi:hypothetical protein